MIARFAFHQLRYIGTARLSKPMSEVKRAALLLAKSEKTEDLKWAVRVL